MRSPRKAITLIEVLTVIAVLSAVFSVILSALFAMQKTNHALSNELARAAQQQRFITQFREDAHQATRVKIDQDNNEAATARLALTGINGQLIEYQLRAQSIDRRVSAEGQPLHIDSYRISPSIEQGWTLNSPSAPRLVTVHLHAGDVRQSGRLDSNLLLRVDAALGLSTPPQESEQSPSPR